MASESGDRSVSLTLSDSLSRWLDDKAREADVSREDLIHQLVAAYRTVSGVDGDTRANTDGGATVVEQFDEYLAGSEARVDERIDERLGDRLDEQLADALDERENDVGPTGDELEARIDEAIEDALAGELGARIDETIEAVLAEQLDTLIDEAVGDALTEQLDDRVDEAVEDALAEELEGRIDETVQDVLAEELETLVDEAIEDALAAELDERVEDVREEFMEKIHDARDRVIQVKKEADAKAEAGHTHPDLDDQLDSVRSELNSVETDLAAVRSTAQTVQDTVQTGFESYREVLEFLSNRADKLNGRINTLARALLETREEIRKLAARDAARSASEDLKRRANKQGIESAECGECEVSVDLGLLTRAECPHCNTPFADVEPARGFFGQNRLVVGEPPALEAGEATGQAAGDEAYDVGVEAVIDESDREETPVEEHVDPDVTSSGDAGGGEGG